MTMESEDVTTPPSSGEEWERLQKIFSILHSTWIVVSLAIMVIGIAGNSLVLYIICKRREMHTATNFYVANLSAADVILLIMCVVPNAVTSHMDRSLFPYFPYPQEQQR